MRRKMRKGTAPRGYTAAEQAEVWERWGRGESLKAIGRVFGKEGGSVFGQLAPYGGIRPRPRRRSPLALTLEEREEISRGVAGGLSMRTIARALSRAPSTVSREIGRNGGRERYRATDAEERAWGCARRPRRRRLSCRPQLQRLVEDRLQLDWSPEQIAGWLKRTYQGNESLQASHETIYRGLYVQPGGGLRKGLTRCLFSRRSIRRSRHSTRKGHGKGHIADMVSIHERPACVESRAEAGHWEGDLVAGSQNSHIVTVVERSTRFVKLVRVSGKDTETVVSALIECARQLPGALYKSLTWDRGREMADHQRFTRETGVPVYFCDPQSPWQRGSNENTNGLLRRYFPKGTDLSVHSQEHLDRVARRLNERPRKTLGYETPAERFAACVALTA
jgi:IS30 family transposase